MKTLFTIMLLFMSVSLFGEEFPDIKEVTKKIDEVYRSKSSYAETEMIIETPDWKRTLSMKMWTKGLDDS